jgi:hypothetical protein
MTNNRGNLKAEAKIVCHSNQGLGSGACREKKNPWVKKHARTFLVQACSHDVLDVWIFEIKKLLTSPLFYNLNGSGYKFKSGAHFEYNQNMRKNEFFKTE